MSQLLLLPRKSIFQTPPKDRGVWIIANLITHSECFLDCEPFEGYARWDEASQDWLTARGLSIRGSFDTELHVLEWRELAERATGAPDHEMMIFGDIHHHDSELAWEIGRAGFWAYLRVSHSPTLVSVFEREAGPFPLRSLAVAALSQMFLELEPEAAQAVAV